MHQTVKFHIITAQCVTINRVSTVKRFGKFNLLNIFAPPRRFEHVIAINRIKALE